MLGYVYHSTYPSAPAGATAEGSLMHTKPAQRRLAAGIIASVTVLSFLSGFGATAQADPPNLVTNPGAEAGTAGWTPTSWGDITAAFGVSTDAHSGNSALSTKVTTRSSGAANWHQPVTVTAGTTYTASVWAKSTVATELGAEFTTVGGTTQYLYLGPVTAGTTWQQVTAIFTAPSGATKVSVFVPLSAVGTILTDDYSLQVGGTPPPPSRYDKGMVSVDFDDGWKSQSKNAAPVLKKYGLKATFYVNGSFVDNTADGYMTATQIKALATAGHEIGNHTWDHEDLATLNRTQIDAEWDQSQSEIVSKVGVAPKVCAYPFGSRNADTLASVASRFAGCRTTDGGFNSPLTISQTGRYQLMDYNVTASTTLAQLKQAINDAATSDTWLILVFHEVGASLGGDEYYTSTSTFGSAMSYLQQQVKAGKVKNVTASQGLAAA